MAASPEQKKAALEKASIGDIVVDAEKDIKIAASDVLVVANWLKNAGSLISIPKMSPQVLAAFAVLLSAVGASVVTGMAAASQDGINFALDSTAAQDIMAVWPDIQAFMADLGVKI